MALPRATDVEYLGTNGSGGMVVGFDATEKVGFYGKAPVVQPTAIAASTDTTTTTSTTTALTADLDSLRVKFNDLLTRLRAVGLLAT